MSEVCFKEFKGWCKSFTKTEIYLSLLEVIFLIVLITFLIFLVLHFLACAKYNHENENETTPGGLTDSTKLPPSEITPVVPTTEPTQLTIQPSTISTLGKEIECTWMPSKKTDAVSHYYERDQDVTVPTQLNVKDRLEFNHDKSSPYAFKSDTTKKVVDSNSDVDIVDNDRKSFLLALVKIRHPRDMLFGCTLTVISSHWTLSAASCIEAVEEVDALDSFVMMERFGEPSQGEIHELSDVIIHPEYRSVNKNFDLVAIKSEDLLLKGSPTITLPTLLDNSLITLGERLGVLGFGKFSTEVDHLDRRVREVSVYKMVRSQCSGTDTWAARHLADGHAVERGAGGPSPRLCAGRVGSETESPCPCGGAPLLHSHMLLGVMSDDGACGLSCRPALYVDVALHRDWIDSVLQGD